MKAIFFLINSWLKSNMEVENGKIRGDKKKELLDIFLS
jgi:hypothetical protein